MIGTEIQRSGKLAGSLLLLKKLAFRLLFDISSMTNQFGLIVRGLMLLECLQYLYFIGVSSLASSYSFTLYTYINTMTSYLQFFQPFASAYQQDLLLYSTLAIVCLPLLVTPIALFLSSKSSEENSNAVYNFLVAFLSYFIIVFKFLLVIPLLQASINLLTCSTSLSSLRSVSRLLSHRRCGMS